MNKTWFFEMIREIDKPSIRLKGQDSNNRKVIILLFLQNWLEESYEHLYIKKWDDQYEIDRFLGTQPPKLNHEETENLGRPVTCKDCNKPPTDRYWTR